MDQPTDMDLMAGLPQQQGGELTAALRNLGSTDAVVNVTATTSTGQSITAQATVPTHDFGQVSFKNATGIVRIEIDPEKFYPQLDYANDVAPKALDVAVSLAEANRLYGTQEFAKAEALARQLLAASPKLQEGHVILGRALLAENKIDDAEKEFNQLLNDSLPTPVSLAWASLGLGGVALRRSNAEAAQLPMHSRRRRIRKTLTRAERLKLNRGNSGRGGAYFINQLTPLCAAAVSRDLAADSSELRFVHQVVGLSLKRDTRVLRTGQLDANRVAVDVALTTRQLGVDHTGTAVFILPAWAADSN